MNAIKKIIEWCAERERVEHEQSFNDCVRKNAFKNCREQAIEFMQEDGLRQELFEVAQKLYNLEGEWVGVEPTFAPPHIGPIRDIQDDIQAIISNYAPEPKP